MRVAAVAEPKAMHAFIPGLKEAYRLWRLGMRDVVKGQARSIRPGFPGGAFMVGEHEIARDLHLMGMRSRRLFKLMHDAGNFRICDVQYRHRHVFHMGDEEIIALFVDAAAVAVARQIAVPEETHVPAFRARRDFRHVRIRLCHGFLLAYLRFLLENDASLLNCLRLCNRARLMPQKTSMLIRTEILC